MPFRLQQCLSRFRRDQRGNIAIIFAIAAIPLVSAIGCAVDYSLATRMKAKMQSAADAAGIAALSQKSPGFIAAAAMPGSGSVDAGVTDANNVFDANMSGITGYQNLVRTSTVTKTGIKLAANIQFSADVPVTFMKVLGYQKLTVTGLSSSAATLPPYLDFYLTLDVSGSMGLPSTTAEAVRMQSINPDNYVQYPTGCTLACHFAQPPVNQLYKSACIDPSPNTPSGAGSVTQKYPTGNYCLGYEISRVSQSAYNKLLQNHSGKLPAYKYTSINTSPTQIPQPTAFYSTNSKYPNDPVLSAVSSCPTPGTDNCIQLRLDAVGFALNATVAANGVDGLLALAQKKEIVTDQFRIGLYPFIKDIDKTYAPLTKTINGSDTTPGTINYAAKNLAKLLDTNTNSNLGSGGTHIDTALSSVNNLIYGGGTSLVGDGSAPTTPQPYVFLVTDGAQDNQYKDVPYGSWHDSNHATVIDPTKECKTLKGRNIIVSVLYIPYQKIDPVNHSFAGDEDTYANDNIPKIPDSLKACASPGFFYTANTPEEITASLNAMFNHALQTAHITQ